MRMLPAEVSRRTTLRFSFLAAETGRETTSTASAVMRAKRHFLLINPSVLRFRKQKYKIIPHQPSALDQNLKPRQKNVHFHKISGFIVLTTPPPPPPEMALKIILASSESFFVEKGGELWGILYLCGEKTKYKVRTHEIHRQHRRQN